MIGQGCTVKLISHRKAPRLRPQEVYPALALLRSLRFPIPAGQSPNLFDINSPYS